MMLSKKTRSMLSMALVVALIAVIIVLFDIGVFTNFLTSFKSSADISAYPPKWIFRPVLDNYLNVLGKGGYDFGKFRHLCLQQSVQTLNKQLVIGVLQRHHSRHLGAFAIFDTIVNHHAFASSDT